MADYRAVADALKNGADPAMLCGTCPWDRYCISPPSMTTREVEAKQREAEEKDKARAEEQRRTGQKVDLPVGALLTAVMYSGKDLDAKVCPVFSNRLRSSSGRDIVDSLKNQMQTWDDGRI